VLVVVSVVAVVVCVASYLTWLAQRLDRLAVRVEAARSALDAQLVRRAAIAHDLAHDATGIGSPEVHRVARAAMAVRDTGDGDRATAENALTRALRSELESGTTPLADADELRAAAERVVLARQIHNDGVRDLLALRQRRLVRWLHLYGYATAPSYLEFDVAMPVPPAP